MGGPAMIEGGGLGACGPKDIGPASDAGQGRFDRFYWSRMMPKPSAHQKTARPIFKAVPKTGKHQTNASCAM